MLQGQSNFLQNPKQAIVTKWLIIKFSPYKNVGLLLSSLATNLGESSVQISVTRETDVKTTAFFTTRSI